MKTQNDQAWREIRWRRPLTPAEMAGHQRWLAEHPGHAAAWEDEEALSLLLEGLPETPVSSNFTARVWEAVAAEERRAASAPPRGFSWRGWWERALPRLAWGGVAAAVVLAGVHQYRGLERARVARDMARIALVATLPPAEVFADFDAITQLATRPAPEKRAEEGGGGGSLPGREAKRGPLPSVSDEALYAAF